MKILTRLTCALAFVCAVSSAAVCTNPVCPVTGSFITDPSGTVLASGTIVFVPNTAFRIPAKGQAVPTVVSAPITNGSFSTFLADTTQTIPANITYRAYVMDASGKVVSGANYYNPTAPYQSIQMTGAWCISSGCNFDLYNSSSAVLPLVRLTHNDIADWATATAALGGGTGGGIWGSITGTLSNQTDLTTALSLKQDSLGFTAENAANKGAVNGYAPLNGSQLVPLANLPTIPSSKTSGFATVATSGAYADLSGKPTIPAAVTLQTNGVVNGSQAVLNLKAGSNMTLSDDGAGGITFTSAGSGGGGGGGGVWGSITGVLSSQTDLATALNAKQNSLGFTAENAANKGAAGGYAPLNGSQLVPLVNLPTIPSTQTSGFATVASSGAYADLSGKPTIPAAQVNSDWNAVSGLAQILNKPTIPAAQVNSDWTAVSGLSQILNKPSLATVATSGAYADLSGKPTIPSAVTLKTNGTNNGSQTILNLKAGSNMSLADDGAGGITLTSSASGGTSNPPGGSTNAVQVNGGSSTFAGVSNATGTKQYLTQVSGALPVFGTIQAADVPTLNQNTTGSAATATAATNLSSGTVGSIPYQSASNTTAFVSGNTAATDQVLVSHGTGSAAQAPTLTNAPTLSAANMTGLPAANLSGILGVSNGGTGTATPGIVAGTNVTVTGTWPNQTIASPLPTASQSGQALVSSGAGTTYTATTLATSATTDTTTTANVNYTAPSGTVRTQAAKNQDIVSVKDYNAKGDGSTDDTTAINATFTYATANNKTVVFPAGTYIVTSSIEVTASVRGDRNVTIKASGITGAGSSVLKAGSTTPVSNLYIEGITVDANGTADNGIFLRQYKHLMMDHVNILNFAVNGLHAGDTSISTPTFYELMVHDLRVERTTGTIPVASSGIFIDGGTDSSVSQSIVMDSDIGIQTNTGGNFFTDIHLWSHPSKGNMTIGVQINSGANGNFLKGVEADTVSVVGFKDASFNTQYEGCRIFNGTAYSIDNLAYGWWFTQTTPSAAIRGALIIGLDSTHRLLYDVFPAGLNSVAYENNFDSNVTNHVADSNRFITATQVVGNITVGSANEEFFGPKTRLGGAANAGSATDGGTLLVRNNSATGYGAVALGSTASSGVKLLANNSTTLDLKLGDESAYTSANLLGATLQGGNLLFATDGTGTIGAVGANRPANIYAQNTIRAAGGFVGALYPGAFTGSNIFSASDGFIQLRNNAGTAFTGLLFGTTTTSSPGLFVNGTELDTKLADNTAFSNFATNQVTLQGGNVLFATDGTGNVGASGATRPGNVFVQNTVRAAGALIGKLYPNTANSFTGTNIVSSVDGNLQITNGAGTDFTCLQFGVTTSAGPAWCKSGSVLKARLADNSADTTISAGGVQWGIVNKSATYTAVATDYTIVGDATSGAFAVNLEASPTIGQVHVIKKKDASGNAVTINGNGHNVDTSATLALSTQGAFAVVHYDTANTIWNVIGSSATGSGSISGLTTSAIVTAASATSIQTPSATATMDTSGNVSTPGSVTAASFVASGTTPGADILTAGTGSINGGTLAANSAGLAAPATGGTSYLLKLPATITAGILTTAAPAIADGVNESAVTVTSTTGSGSVVLATSPTLTTPTIGVATATSVNKVAITAPATSATLTIANGKTLTASNTLTLAGTDSTTMTFPSASATITQTIGSGTLSLGTLAIASGACATAVTSTITGTATTDTVTWTPNADISAVTGYAPVTTGGLTVYLYPTANTINAKVCNPTASSITPGAVTLNVRVVR